MVNADGYVLEGRIGGDRGMVRCGHRRDEVRSVGGLELKGMVV